MSQQSDRTLDQAILSVWQAELKAINNSSLELRQRARSCIIHVDHHGDHDRPKRCSRPYKLAFKVFSQHNEAPREPKRLKGDLFPLKVNKIDM
jgi:hypothetical protein